MKKIRNSDILLSHGDIESRRIVLTLADETLARLDAYHIIRSIASLDGDILRVGSRSWDLSKKRNVYLIGAGKACNAMAMAFDEILGARLTRGIAIVKIKEPSDMFHHTETYVGGHPLPNETGYHASLEILKLVDASGPDDLFIAVISGGSSALMNCPAEGISLQDEIDATDALLRTGAGIYEINAVRRHISRMNGGMLAKRIQAVGAELIGVGISDGVGGIPTSNIREPYASYASTPIGPDKTTLDDARRVIREYHLERRLPKSVTDYLANADPERETPKAFPGNTYFVLNTVPDSCILARKLARDMGLDCRILTSFLEGESKDAGMFMASVARQIQTMGEPLRTPCLLLSCGETTTRIDDDDVIEGHGGPSQELVTGFAIAAASIPGACMLSIDTEGTDGTTPAAGGITDSATLAAARARGLDLRTALRTHSTYEALNALGDAVYTGNTGTNLCDFNVLYVPALSSYR
ncbi:MAG: DUF4147 domain-containing protein [Oscillospiraceae bacterium]|jgi:glycerate-2-kinase|nr:DUF4147 domain-containing protein [Oscillospiraceae bacterium]